MLTENDSCANSGNSFSHNSPMVQFSQQSRVYHLAGGRKHGHNQICIRRITLHHRNPKSDLSELRGWTIEAVVEDTQTGLEWGRERVHFLLPRRNISSVAAFFETELISQRGEIERDVEKERKTTDVKSSMSNEGQRNLLLDAVFCFQIDTSWVTENKKSLDLSKYESVYMWLMVSTLPPIYDSLPHSHPSNPIQLFSMDTITLYTDENCSVLTMNTNENPENSYRPVSTEKNMKPESDEREPDKSSDKRVMMQKVRHWIQQLLAVNPYKLISIVLIIAIVFTLLGFVSIFFILSKRNHKQRRDWKLVTEIPEPNIYEEPNSLKNCDTLSNIE
ncbi:uncharacterized protein LOC134856110 isoform X2 [Symsagittifera roscoffensis]|uniref:uncharacterized protein LOC134856110 isoform X2 n=1 Tax=Symsagittifera roscoffensis TaxID=84072 RepID=UPI00307C4126